MGVGGVRGGGEKVWGGGYVEEAIWGVLVGMHGGGVGEMCVVGGGGAFSGYMRLGVRGGYLCAGGGGGGGRYVW